MKRGVFCRLRAGNGWIEPRADSGEATPALSNLTSMTWGTFVMEGKFSYSREQISQTHTARPSPLKYD